MRTAFPSEGSETHLRDTAEPSHNTVTSLCTAVSRCGKNQQEKKTWLQTGHNRLRCGVQVPPRQCLKGERGVSVRWEMKVENSGHDTIALR